MSFLAELKRRNVFRVGVAYLIGAWLLIQVADILMDNIGTPPWVMQTLFVILAVGFFIALFLAWAFELTPDGVKRESEVDHSQSISQQTGRKLDRMIIGVLVVAVLFLLYDKTRQPDQSLPASQSNTTQNEPAASQSSSRAVGKSIAVLPFVNMSSDADNEYFSDGLSEELLNLLAKVNGLKVAARTSSFQFKGKGEGIAEIGKTLGVATVLEGSVRKSGKRARITAQLIQVDGGFHLWSETYDRNLDDIFAVQDEIAQAIVDALKLPLLGADEKPLAATKTKSFAAYDLYLLGRHKARKTTADAFGQALNYYKQSLEIDPNYAPAYSGLADTYIFLADYGGLSLAEALPQAQAAVNRALELNPNSDEANASAGLMLINQNKPAAAEQAFKKALSINPNNVLAMVYYQRLLGNEERVQESLVLAEKARALDPLSDYIRARLTSAYTEVERFTEAEKLIQAALAENPQDPFPYEYWANLFLKQAKIARAMGMYRKAHELRPGDTYMAAQNVSMALLIDDPATAAKWLKLATERGPNSQYTERAKLQLLAYQGRWKTNLDSVEEILKAQPFNTPMRVNKANALEQLGQDQAAINTYRKALYDFGYQENQAMWYSQSQAAVSLLNLQQKLAGDESQNPPMDRLLEQLEQVLEQSMRQSKDFKLHLLNAQVASLKNQPDEVINQLQQAIKAGFINRWFLENDPVLKRWINDSRYQQIIQQVKTLGSQQRELLAQIKADKPSNNHRGVF